MLFRARASTLGLFNKQIHLLSPEHPIQQGSQDRASPCGDRKWARGSLGYAALFAKVSKFLPRLSPGLTQTSTFTPSLGSAPLSPGCGQYPPTLNSAAASIISRQIPLRLHCPDFLVHQPFLVFSGLANSPAPLPAVPRTLRRGSLPVHPTSLTSRMRSALTPDQCNTGESHLFP